MPACSRHSTIPINRHGPDESAMNSASNDQQQQQQQQQQEDESPLIQQIGTATAQRLVAGQAITDLSSAVKELVDNAIDAGARRVCVKLVDKGIESIEVTDNGSGVPPSSRPLMAMKHATSKLRNFDDLYNQNDRNAGDCDANNDNANTTATNDSNGNCINDNDAIDCAPTLGFRGEALFCLTNLSRSLVVSTRTADDQVGEQFSFDTEGNLVPESVQRTPRKVGTSVTVYGLFEKVPVRRVDMCKRILGQGTKLMKMMQGYAILCLSTQFNLTFINSPKSSSTKSKKLSKSNKTKSEVRIATSESSKTFESRVSSVLGSKFLAGLTRIEVDLSCVVQQKESATPNTQGTTPANNPQSKWKMTGLISHSPTSPHPSNARDLQFYSINGRPVDLPSVSRTLSDVWRNFDPLAVETKSNGRKRPACVLAFYLPNNLYDVNLSPDKREVMFTEDAAMEELIREGLMRLWCGQSEGQFVANEVESRTNGTKKKSGRAVVGDGKDGGVTNGDGDLEMTDLAASSHGKNKSSLDKNENNGAVAKAKSNDKVDNVTPKLRRKNTPAPSHVTPLDSSGNSPNENAGEVDGGDNCDGDSSSDNDSMSPTTEKKTTQAKETVTAAQEDNADKPTVDNGVVQANQHPNSNVENSSRNDEWDKLQLPERAREQDRRKWEQMRLNFQRVEKKDLQQDMDRILSPDRSNKQGDGQNAVRSDEVSTQPTSTQLSGANSERPTTHKSSTTTTITNDRSTSHEQRKRQKRPKKQDVASFLSSFAYGSTKPAADATELDSDNHHSDSEDSEALQEEDNVPEVVKKPKTSSLNSSINKRNSRMITGRTLVAEKRPRTSLRQDRVEKKRPQVSREPIADVDDQCNDAEPGSGSDSAKPTVEAVWDSFSGTQNVIAQSQHARLMMHKNRKYLQSSIKRRRETNNDGENDTAADQSDAKEEPTVNLTSEDFLHMSIIGQFNLGFILTRCRNHNLWILDQHACDEKYNFERQCNETVIHEQKLIAPLPLELSPSEEHCVMEHMDVFERNGFRFSYDPEKEPRHRLSLTALPHSGSGGDGKKAVQFGKEDVGALCSMLGADGCSSSAGYTAGFDTGVEGSTIAGVNAVRRYAGLAGGGSDAVIGSSIVRLPKAIAMFASRACRGSIMIGDPLSPKEQANILKNLHQTEIPWNCAHGRPTMQHIRRLAKCLKEDDDVVEKHVAGPSLSIFE